MADEKIRTTGPYVPAVVTDWEALAGQVEETISERQAAARPGYWAAWVAFCERGDVYVDPLEASFETFVAFLMTARTLDGDLYHPESAMKVLNGVERHYRAEGLVPAFRDPAYQGAWKQAQDARRRAWMKAPERVKPATFEHVKAMLTTPTQPARQGLAKVVTILLALDLGWGGDMASLTWEQVSVRTHGVSIWGVFVPCAHEEKVPGVPHACLACLVSQHQAASDWTKPVVINEVSAVFQRASAAFSGVTSGKQPSSRSGHAVRTLTYAAGLNERQRALVRHALALWASQDVGLVALRDRAWVAMSYAAGLRMNSDLCRLTRAALVPCRNEPGWVLHLGQAKNDPGGDRGDIRVFTEQRSPLVYQCITDYLRVRDLFAPDADSTLILRSCGSSKHLLPATSGTVGMPHAKFALGHLAGLAGLTEVGYSPYSLRRGYACELEARGHSVPVIQAALRHADPNTTMGYLATEGLARSAVQTLMEKVA